MLVNNITYEETSTTPIINIGINPPFYDVPLFEKMRLLHEKQNGLSSKNYMKKIFGKQLKCVDYSDRNWVWTFSDKENKACINALCSTRGISWECRIESDEDILKEIIKEIENTMLGVKNNV